MYTAGRLLNRTYQNDHIYILQKRIIETSEAPTRKYSRKSGTFETWYPLLSYVRLESNTCCSFSHGNDSKLFVDSTLNDHRIYLTNPTVTSTRISFSCLRNTSLQLVYKYYIALVSPTNLEHFQRIRQLSCTKGKAICKMVLVNYSINFSSELNDESLRTPGLVVRANLSITIMRPSRTTCS